MHLRSSKFLAICLMRFNLCQCIMSSCYVLFHYSLSRCFPTTSKKKFFLTPARIVWSSPRDFFPYISGERRCVLSYAAFFRMSSCTCWSNGFAPFWFRDSYDLLGFKNSLAWSNWHTHTATSAWFEDPDNSQIMVPTCLFGGDWHWRLSYVRIPFSFAQYCLSIQEAKILMCFNSGAIFDATSLYNVQYGSLTSLLTYVGAFSVILPDVVDLPTN